MFRGEIIKGMGSKGEEVDEVAREFSTSSSAMTVSVSWKTGTCFSYEVWSTIRGANWIRTS